MDEGFAQPGQVIELIPGTGGASRKTLVVKTRDMEILQLTIAAGQGIPLHEAQGEIVLHCLQGRISVSAIGVKRDLTTGQLVYLATNEPFSIRGIENASLLVTIVTAKQGPNVDVIGK